MRILLIEDDPMIGRTMQLELQDASFATDWVKTGDTALTSLQVHPYDVVLLDLGLPERDGLTILKTLRRNGNSVPVLIITARDTLQDRVAGLDAGADDYIVKPFEMDEVLARIRAVSRRQSASSNPIMGNDSLTLDPATFQACVAGQTPVQLTNREFSLLHALLIRPGSILSRSDLESKIYGWGEEVESNAVEFLIHSLRKKLGNNTIKNIRGAGWMVPKSQ